MSNLLSVFGTIYNSTYTVAGRTALSEDIKADIKSAEVTSHTFPDGNVRKSLCFHFHSTSGVGYKSLAQDKQSLPTGTVLSREQINNLQIVSLSNGQETCEKIDF